MAAINNMYRVSLQQFLELHDFAVNNSDKAPIAAKRIVNILEYMTKYVSSYMHRGLFERHKKIWTLMLAMKIEQVADRLSAAYVGNLLKGGGALDAKSEKPAPAKWIPEAVWLNVIALSRTVAMLRDLPDNFERYNDAWKTWYDHDAPETQPFPDYNERLDQFEKMLLVRSIREDRALIAIDTYIESSIGRDYLLVEPLDMAKMHDEASAFVPMITILSTGSDPTGKINDLARKRKKTVLSISMGQGQEPAARTLLNQGITEGIWVLLQNCHLGLSFMGECMEWVAALPKLQESAPGSVQPTFRLWITANRTQVPDRAAAAGDQVHQRGARRRDGRRQELVPVAQPGLLDSVSDPKWKTMLFALCFFHTIVQERRKFGPLGFNIPYEFSQADLSACVNYMQKHLNMMETKKRPVDWITVNYMVCDVQYGGKITDDWDRRLLHRQGVAQVPRAASRSTRLLHGQHPEYRPNRAVPQVHRDAAAGGRPRDLWAPRQRRPLVPHVADQGGARHDPRHPAQGGPRRRRRRADARGDRAQHGRRPAGQAAARPQGRRRQAGDQGARRDGQAAQHLPPQEVDRLQKVIAVVRASLANLKLAIAGTIVMSPDLTNALDALFLARVPAGWVKASSFEAPSLGVWFPTSCSAPSS